MCVDDTEQSIEQTSLILLLLKGVSSKSNMKWQIFNYGFIHFVRTQNFPKN